MMGCRLFRRRTVLVPTAAGMLLCLAALTVFGACSLYALPRYLAVDDRQGHGLLVVEGWITRDAVRAAAETYRRSNYEAIVVTGGPVEDPDWRCGYATHADRAGAELRRVGLVEPALAVVPAPASAQDRTYSSAVSVRQWAESTGRKISAIDVYSQGPHARRSRTLYRIAFGPAVEVSVIAAPPSEYDLRVWWRSSSGAKDVMGEAFSYAWTVLWFRPGRRGSHEELWSHSPPRPP